MFYCDNFARCRVRTRFERVGDLRVDLDFGASAQLLERLTDRRRSAQGFASAPANRAL